MQDTNCKSCCISADSSSGESLQSQHHYELIKLPSSLGRFYILNSKHNQWGVNKNPLYVLWKGRFHPLHSLCEHLLYFIKVWKAGRQTDALMEPVGHQTGRKYFGQDSATCQPLSSSVGLTESVSGHITLLSCKVLFVLLFTVAFVWA